jgi:hypothetical protein
VLLFVLGLLRAFGIGRFLMLEYQKSSAANTKHPQSASRFASLAYFTRTISASTKRKRLREKFQTKTARDVGTAGDDFCTQHEEPAVPTSRALSGVNSSRTKNLHNQYNLKQKRTN